MEAKTGGFPAWFRDRLKAGVPYNAVKVYVGPSKQDYVPIDSRGRSDSPRAVAAVVEHSGSVPD